ncbi:hypothetical protein LS72_009970 [Helicobacter apodemus]|uniref:Uncharacterized protein n=1 Tax=Helicobacter apodemus TaxID=135569 RepID=A0A4U8UDR9_9HELI|nr:hypothetical protein [Helicobacter apodemus]TLE13389.1 hypothetical protein LS72_009970 [Helicobacter apodemus]
MNKIIDEHIQNLSSKYGVSEAEVVNTIEQSLSTLLGRVQINSYRDNGNYIFYKTLINRFNEYRESIVSLKSHQKDRLQKILTKNLKYLAKNKNLEKIKYAIQNEYGIISGEVVKKNKNGYFIATKFGIAYAPNNKLIVLERKRGLYTNKSIINFHIHSIQKRDNLIILDRISHHIILRDIQQIFSNPKEIIHIERNFNKIKLISKSNLPKKEIIELAKLYRERVRVEVIR